MVESSGSSDILYVLWREGKSETIIWAGEGHEMGEKVSVSRAGMSCM